MTKCNIGNPTYMQFVADGEERHNRGERMLRCTVCMKWVWLDQVSEEHRKFVVTQRQYGKMLRDAVKELVK